MKKAIYFLFLFIVACTSKPKGGIFQIRLINNRSSLKITGLNPAIAGEINRDSSSTVWQSLLPVYKMPADTDLKDFQPIQQGKYVMVDSIIIFTPDTPFIKNNTYFLRFYKFDEGTRVMDYIKGKGKLKRNNHIDLIFK